MKDYGIPYGQVKAIEAEAVAKVRAKRLYQETSERIAQLSSTPEELTALTLSLMDASHRRGLAKRSLQNHNMKGDERRTQ